MIWTVIIFVFTIPVPNTIAGPIRTVASVTISIVGFAAFINWIVTLVDSDRCKKAGYWSGWPWPKGRKFRVDEQGLRQDEPWSSATVHPAAGPTS